MAGDEDRGAPGGDSAESLPQVLARDGIQADGRLVEDEEFGIRDEGAGQADAVRLAARVGAHPAVGQRGQTHDLQGFVDALHARTRQGGEVAQILTGGKVLVDGGGLSDVADAIAYVGGAGNVPQDGDPAFVALNADEGAHERGLAAAGGAEQTGDSTGGQGDVEAVEDLVAAAPHAQVLNAYRNIGIGVVHTFHHVMNI